ncbi:hypothetical protein AB1Y20_022709 [Prymnesium parvum]|uniref:Uncharacterized protein n=1 Tax=Prymnesium parvum TaxID=97485 RepID=A0AB34JID5_PRYPA
MLARLPHAAARSLLLLLLVHRFTTVGAPKNAFSFVAGDTAGVRNAWSSTCSTTDAAGSSNVNMAHAGAAACATAAAVGAAAAGKKVKRMKFSFLPRAAAHCDDAVVVDVEDGASDDGDAFNFADDEGEVFESGTEDNLSSSSEPIIYESDVQNDADDNCEDCETDAAVGRESAGKLWSAAQFPEGIKGASCWDLENIAAAQAWECPCTDRNCLSVERYPKANDLYDFRKTFQTSSRGLRDTFRKKYLQPAYSAMDHTFSRSVVIGGRNDNCIAAAGLAAGLSFGTFANARADTRRHRPYHDGRVAGREKKESMQRSHLNAYIRDLRSTMEGDKGGSSEGKWYTGKRSVALRWADYKKSRQKKSLPIIGSESLFTKLWKEHEEIVQYGAVGHAKCKDCGKHDAELDGLGDRTDSVAQERRKALAEWNAMHTEEHMGERRYAEDAWFRGETYPERMTCVRIDAPTQHQFDLPRQRRISRDMVKSLDGAKRWSSKITGAQVSIASLA